MSWRFLVRKRVLVNLHSGSAVAGVLVKRRGGLLFLSNCEVIPSQGSPASADGQIVIERSQVEFIQILS